MATLKTLRKKSGLLPALLFFAIVSSAWTQAWEYDCTTGSRVEIIGTGTGNRGMVLHNPAVLTIANPAEVDSILAQVLVKVPEGVPSPEKVIISTATETIELTHPTLTTVGAAWYYECKLAPAANVEAQVLVDGHADYRTPRSFTLYVFRKNEMGRIDVGKLMHAALWWDAADRPASWSEVATIPPSTGPRPVRVTFAVADKDANTLRNVRLHAHAGGIWQEVFLTTPNREDELIIYTITLANVPGNATVVTSEVSSIYGTGDSIYWIGLDIEAPCAGDLGDAPDPTFPTRLASQGAYHLYRPDFFLGNLFDAEADGQPESLANGDDFNGLDDEDGVTFTSPLIQGSPATVDVTATASGILNAWFDFNGNGSWADATDHIFINRPLSAGMNHLAFVVPLTEKPNLNCVCRFRFNSDGGLAFTGPAADGEVEDYVIDVNTPVELASFAAATHQNRVVLEWVTQSETENLGFHIFRSASELGNFVQISPSLIRGAGSSSSRHTYRYFDLDVLANETYYYQLASVSHKGTMQMHGYIKVELTAPAENRLEPNMPNPFNSKTRIAYSVRQQGVTHLSVYNLQGQRVRWLVSQPQSAGSYSVIWDGRDEQGLDLPSGTYIYTLQNADAELSGKMTMVK